MTQAKKQVTESKTETTEKAANAELQAEQRKPSNFDLVAGGTCPHDGKPLGDEVPTMPRTRPSNVAEVGSGVNRTCTGCDHTWYLNREIHTCKCQTCSANKRKIKRARK